MSVDPKLVHPENTTPFGYNVFNTPIYILDRIRSGCLKWTAKSPVAKRRCIFWVNELGVDRHDTQSLSRYHFLPGLCFNLSDRNVFTCWKPNLNDVH